ncbi:hypothetical protein BJ875DRAFT_251636 [Amylocarpus encephaloides]|uniref:Zn(2)-C6 fungal-type domain-containing protein n=1 Tax=Amylocarpus encephaloides TaxID=45428 RepID=A0A9P7YMU0_9HELO|nr:hypothetical protein BJ875DRAFT_251636 [Amylocarpus encephaloides]
MDDSASISSQGKKPRASKPKVKTGCVTCKQRRVKCDETKPECLRCSNFGRKCGGYPVKEDSPPPKGPTLAVPRKLLSKAMQISPSPSPRPSPSPSPVPQMQIAPPTHRPLFPSGVTCQDEREYRYFNHFRDVTALELSSGFDPRLWNVLVLEACDITAIRQLTIATAALSLAASNSASVMENMEHCDHHQYALQMYGESLRAIREMVTTGHDSMRIALISALLIFCFESISGDISRAVTHAQSAVEMIVRRISHAPRTFYFPRINALGYRETAPIDEDLLTAFMRLDRPSLTLLSSRVGGRPSEIDRIFNILFCNEHLEIPRGFATITEARVCFEDISWRMLTTTQPPAAITKVRDTDPAGISSADHMALPLQLKSWYESAEVLSTFPALSTELAHWHDAFSPILNYAMGPTGDSLFMGSVMLHIQALSAELFATGSFTPTTPRRTFETPNEEPTEFPTAHAIISLARRVVAHHQFSTGFVFDEGLIPALVHLWLLCPDLELKRQAIGVLESMRPRREGSWDSTTAAAAGRRFLQQESNGEYTEMIDPMLLGEA